MSALRAAGAEQVFSGEAEIALAVTEAVLERLGASPEQIDRERDRVREELFGSGNSPRQRALALGPQLAPPPVTTSPPETPPLADSGHVPPEEAASPRDVETSTAS
jgi:hypothetical protein